ncbi:hypothetical protein PybrP1_008237 [[Pythium] brassicae (nom. inval.)]|nr:hypothetical protein PybrP1_008237 [[Pythium] brassicae (nom. inval.)]
MIECTTCGAQGEANFSTNYFGELVCELCGTQSFLQSRNETQDMEDTNLDVTRTSTMKRTMRGAGPRAPSGAGGGGGKQLTRRGTGRRMKRRGDSATLLDCLRATQTILDHQARALQQLAGFPDEFVGAVEQIWFLFLETWERKSSRPLLRCFTEFFLPLGAADKAMDPALTQQLLEQWDADRATEAAEEHDDEAGAEASERVSAGNKVNEEEKHEDDGDDEEEEEEEEEEDAGDFRRQGSTRAAKRKAAQRVADARRRQRQRQSTPTQTTRSPAPPRAKKRMRLAHYSAALEQFSILDLLGMLALAARALNLGVLPCDVAHWVATGALPFHNLLAVCAPELQAAVYDVSLFFESTLAGHRVTAARVAYHAHFLQHHLALPLPPLNASLAAFTMCANVGFPPQVFRHFQWLAAHVNVKGGVPEPPLLHRRRRRAGSAEPLEVLESAVGIAAHVAVAVKMTANWHEWIYERPGASARSAPPYRVQDARQLPRCELDAFVDFCEDTLVGRDRANVPTGFEGHVYDLRGKYSERGSHAGAPQASGEAPSQHPLLAYPALYVDGVCAEQDDEIEARVASIRQRMQAAQTGTPHDDKDADADVFFYPLYARNVKFPVLHAAYESVLERLCEYIDAPIATVLRVAEQLDQEVHAACRALEADVVSRRQVRDKKAPDHVRASDQSMGACASPEAKNNLSGEEATVIKLYCQMPPIAKLDNSLNTLKNCEQLSLSTNCIDRLIPLSGMKKLRILSLGRNQIKKIEKLDDVSDTLEELWISYNVIATLDGLAGLANLTTLYLSNNLIKSWDELDKLANLPKLRDVLFVGNPIYENLSKEEQRLNVLKRIPKVAKIDGDMVKQTERDAAMGQ